MHYKMNDLIFSSNTIFGILLLRDSLVLLALETLDNGLSIRRCNAH